MISKIRSALISWLRSILCVIYALRLSKYPELKRLLDAFASTESAAIDLADAIAIYEVILRRRPKYLLELGTGTSSVVIALAINRLQKEDATYTPTFITIEENEQWLNYHEQHFPIELRPLAQIICRPVVGKVIGNEKVACYAEIPIYPYEFIHIDGPLKLLGAKVSSDLLDIEPHLANCCYAIFDGRHDSARFAMRHLESKNFSFHRNLYSLNHELSRE